MHHAIPPAALPPASIVVNTYNRAAYLDDALKGLMGLDYPEFEVIVVNGPSTDDSDAVIARWGDRIKALKCPEANLSKSRNVGIAAAAGAFVCFIDDDAVPHPQWLRRLALAYADPEVGGAGGFTVDNTGTAWQVRKTVCDRFGNAHNVTEFFDERPLNRAGSPFYPSLLGTNSSFRTTALRAIGGFDHTFAYLLDETDVCLRLVDAGWKVVYEPSAVVFHQFAPSHIRSPERIARTLYPSAVSKSYFIARHGGRADLRRAGEELERYREEIARANAWLCRHGKITDAHRFSLDEDLQRGIAEGTHLALRRGGFTGGDLKPAPVAPLQRFPTAEGRRIVLVSRGWPPDNEAGIARWTALLAQGLSARGHTVHVITRATGGEESVRFVDGLWVHRLLPDEQQAAPAMERYALPSGLAAWAMRVWREVVFLKSFGVDLVSFPIWDLEGLPLLDEPDLTTVVSLHTTYAMARPFKPEWTERVLFARTFTDKVIAAERALFQRAPHLLANSQAIVASIEADYAVSIADRATVVPHGTPDPLTAPGQAVSQAAADPQAPLRVLFVGRFEPRKGFDIAVEVARRVLDMDGVDFAFAGARIDEAARTEVERLGALAILDSPQVAFLGELSREALDRAYLAADVVLMPSRFESFGLVAIEAMAAGRPVLALDAGGLGEVALPGNGARAWPDDGQAAAHMAEEIALLARDRAELARRGALARAAWERDFSVDAMIDGIEAFYAQVLAPRGGEVADVA